MAKAPVPHDAGISVNNALSRAFARMDGVARQDLKFNIGAFFFKQRWNFPGLIKVYYDRKYCGKISDNRFAPASSLETGLRQDVRSILQDPKAAAMKHGLSTGCCACCGRELSDPASLFMGIGPICLNNFGWADDSIDVEDL